MSTKKLSIEQRLSLAAKTKPKKKSKKLSSPVPEVDPKQDDISGSRSRSVLSVVSGSELEADSTASPNTTTIFDEIFPDGYDSLSNSELLERLAPELQRLRDGLVAATKSLEDERSKRPVGATEDASLLRLLKEKDLEIAQLRKEKDDLSKNEVKHTNIIQGMIKKEAKLADSMQDLEGKLSDKTAAVKEMERELSKVRQELDQRNKKLFNLESELKSTRETHQKLEKEYSGIKEQLKLCQADVNSTELKLEALKEDNAEQKRLLIEKYDQLKATSNSEITRLEGILESLRLENETLTHGGKLDSAENSQYKELLLQYETVQKEFQKSKDSWVKNEFSINEKIQVLETKLNELERINAELTEKCTYYENDKHRIYAELNASNQRNEESNIRQLQLENELKKCSDNLSSLRDDYSLLQDKFEMQKRQLEARMSKMGDNSTRVDYFSANSAVTEGTSFKDYTPIDETPFPVDLPTSDDASLRSIPGSDIPEEAADLNANRKSSTESNPASHAFTGPSAPPVALNHRNAHLISKLSSELRRLEAESLALKELNRNLEDEKSRAKEEIIQLLEENQSVKALRTSKDELQSEFKSLAAKQEKVLQLLGEKSERVEELENDVKDLNELIHMQVQQMVELQEAARK
ncbi:HEL324Cp [Eremothecium sinecaudum]|uniref:HEL324Cp n=1 Tax=Eremothecium sinecaudum TaxID=45286 RepID=A0A120K2B1_9SACH|nr:HEL324Cp [Eremothecium sinecaudum]AMD20957.1 HEL324Cp [Eremothecium sinecaudum]